MMRPEVRFNKGSNRVVEAVELDSGTVIVVYRYVIKFKTERGYRYQIRICFKVSYDRPPLSFVIEQGYQDKYPKKKEG